MKFNIYIIDNLLKSDGLSVLRGTADISMSQADVVGLFVPSLLENLGNIPGMTEALDSNLPIILLCLHEAIATECNLTAMRDFQGSHKMVYANACLDDHGPDHIGVDFFAVREYAFSGAKDGELTYTNSNTVTEKRSFLCTNGALKFHRSWLLYLLEQKGLIKEGHCSYLKHCYSDDREYDVGGFRLVNGFDQIVEKYHSDTTPILLDENSADLYNGQPFRYCLSLINNTDLSLITESFVHEADAFITEKTYRPIVLGHPFIVWGQRHHLKRLREMGFKTFSPYIDESYDEIEDRGERLEALISALDQFIQDPHDLTEITNYNKKFLKVHVKNTIDKFENDIKEFL